MFGLGKHRSKYGRFLDKHDITQEEVVKKSKLNRDTVSKACTDDDANLRTITKRSLTKAARDLSGRHVEDSSFW